MPNTQISAQTAISYKNVHACGGTKTNNERTKMTQSPEVNPVRLTQTAMKKTAIESIFHHVLPIVYKSGELESTIGTATLIQENSKYYVITAAHVLIDKITGEHIQEKIGTPIDGKWVPFRGTLYHTKLDAIVKGSNEDRIDIAIFQIEDDIRKLIESKYRFYDVSGKSTIPVLENGIRYIVAGFPADSYQRYGTQVYGMCFGFLTTSDDVEKLGFSSHESIALNYDTNALVDISSQSGVYGYYPDGMSGGLIAYFPKLIGAGDMPYLIVGILIEYKSSDEVIIATKINIAFAIIEKYITGERNRENAVRISGAVHPLVRKI